ncbi:hypothetical protein V3C99_010527 [Haemonchus contortus]
MERNQSKGKLYQAQYFPFTPLFPHLQPSDRTAITKNQQTTTGSDDCKSNVALEEPNDLSLNQPKDYFPWNRLPKELQVKVLRNLTRSDLDKCRVLNRKTFQLIRHNEKSMKRRIIEYLQIRIFETEKSFRLGMFARCSEVGITHDRDLSMFNRRKQRTPYTFEHALQHLQESFSPWSCSILPKLLKNATIQHLQIGYLLQGRLTDNILWPISSCLLNVDCRVQRLSIEDTSFAAVTSSVFLEFLRNAAPTHIFIYGIRDCSYDNFSPEVLEFIVTRPKFEIIYVQPEPFPIDDDIFAKLTASEFTINVTTKITADGIKSFVGGLASGKHEVVKGLIRTGVFSSSSPFSTPSNVKVSLITDPNNMYNSKPYYIEITATTKCTAKTKT